MANRKHILGYIAGITTGVSYGFNPFFAKPLMEDGVPIDTILFFRYAISIVLLSLFMLCRKESFKMTLKQACVMLLIGVLYPISSITLFQSYRFVPSGLATTIIFLCPVIVAITMCIYKKYPTWQVWTAIVIAFGGIVLMCRPGGGESLDIRGVLLALGSAASYAFFMVGINNNKTISGLSPNLITLSTMVIGTAIFSIQAICNGHQLIGAGTSVDGAAIVNGIHTGRQWLAVVGLALLPTIISTSTLAYSTRAIGATRASVLGVFEPLTAILLGTLAFSEPLTLNIAAGVLISIFAVLFMILSEKKFEKKLS